jgi:hypothetical protein
MRHRILTVVVFCTVIIPGYQERYVGPLILVRACEARESVHNYALEDPKIPTTADTPSPRYYLSGTKNMASRRWPLPQLMAAHGSIEVIGRNLV